MAELPSRASAFLIDVTIQTLAIFGMVLVFLLGLGLNAGSELESGVFPRHLSSPGLAVLVALGIGTLALFLMFFGYFIFFEAVWRGQTPGKRLLGLRVIRQDGTRLGLAGAAIRNLLRVADSLPLFYGVGILSIILSRRRQRLGDFAAGTIVVRDVVALRPVSLALPLGRHPDVPAVFAERAWLLGEELGEAVELYQSRREALFPARRAELARRLAGLVTRQVGELPGDADDILKKIWLARRLAEKRKMERKIAQ